MTRVDDLVLTGFTDATGDTTGDTDTADNFDRDRLSTGTLMKPLYLRGVHVYP
ncbi:Uu.00g050340.m01.CDS01 [Anthostomella pinea]|uniref:Uu.00g050340.m01.CDS01 n=1 Tax=Anthostomella pinea TaxID=933095 RepID=A0AAI8VSK2_9PEZI|nr:Uu.00g050340.m01.CDS01 [Anthostomella pinea]